MDAPNLDCMPDDELMSFWQKHQGGRAYRELFNADQYGGGLCQNATADLANYASNLATARACRLRGDIATAQMYEGICDRIYSKLPPIARW